MRPKLLEKSGDFFLTTGNLDLAEAMYEKALVIAPKGKKNRPPSTRLVQQLARTYARKGNLEKVEQLLGGLTDKANYKDDAEVKIAIASTLIEKHPEAATRILTQAIDQLEKHGSDNPYQHAQAWQHLGDAQSAAGYLSEAFLAYQRCLELLEKAGVLDRESKEIATTKVHAAARLAEISEKRRDFESAAGYYSMALNTIPKSLVSRIGKGRINRWLNSYRDILARLDRTREIDAIAVRFGRYDLYRHSRGTAQAGKQAVKLKGVLIGLCAGALVAGIAIWTGQALYAEPAFRICVTGYLTDITAKLFGSDSAQYWKWRVDSMSALSECGHQDEVDAAYAELKAALPGAKWADNQELGSALSTLGKYYADRGRYLQGLKFCELAIEVLSKHPSGTRVSLANAYTFARVSALKMGDYAKVLALMKEDIAVHDYRNSWDPKPYPYMLSDHATTLQRLHRYPEAVAKFERAVELLEKRKSIDLHEERINLCKAYADAGMFEKAGGMGQLLAANDRFKHQSTELAAYLLWKEKKYPEAIGAYNRAITAYGGLNYDHFKKQPYRFLGSHAFEAAHDLARCYTDAGKPNEAAAIYAQLLKNWHSEGWHKPYWVYLEPDDAFKMLQAMRDYSALLKTLNKPQEHLRIQTFCNQLSAQITDAWNAHPPRR